MEIWNKKFDRRNFIKAGAGAAAALTVASMLPKKGFAAPRNIPTTAMPFSKVVELTPEEMAQRSPLQEYALNFLKEQAYGLSDSNIRDIVLSSMEQPDPLVMKTYDRVAKEAIRQKLLDAGYISPENTVEQIFPPITTKLSFTNSPGAGWGGHHAYPGGLITHVSTDLQSALNYIDTYEKYFGYSMNKELTTEAILLHDLTKPWILQWTPDGKCLPEIKIGGTGCHHIQQVAECMLRGLRPEVVVAVAVSHDHAGWDSAEVKPVTYIKAAAIIAGKDPVKEHYLAPDGKTLPLPRRPESFLVNFGDGDFTLTSGISRWTKEALEKVALSDYHLNKDELDGIKFNRLRSYLYSQASDMHLYQIYVDEGFEAVRKAFLSIVTPD